MIPSFEQVMEFTESRTSVAAFELPECRAYYDLLCGLPQRATVLEIGLQFGRSSSIVGQLVGAKNFNYIGIDPFRNPPESLPEWSRVMSAIGCKFTLYCMKTVDVMNLPMFDLALIDGDHEPEGITMDCSRVLSLIKPRGYALFHDYGHDSLATVKPTVDSIMAARWTGAWEQMETVGTLAIWRRLSWS